MSREITRTLQAERLFWRWLLEQARYPSVAADGVPSSYLPPQLDLYRQATTPSTSAFKPGRWQRLYHHQDVNTRDVDFRSRGAPHLMVNVQQMCFMFFLRTTSHDGRLELGTIVAAMYRICLL